MVFQIFNIFAGHVNVAACALLSTKRWKKWRYTMIHRSMEITVAAKV